MGISVAAQTLLFFKSMCLGACLMLLYDGFRILRLAVKTPAALILLEDILFFAACAVASFLFLISANFGEIRLFALLGELLGAILCALTLSRVVMACSKAIIRLVRAVFRLVMRIFFLPVYRVIRWLAGLVVKIGGFFGRTAKKSLHKANYGLKRRRIMLYNLFMSERRKKKKPKQSKGKDKAKDEGTCG